MKILVVEDQENLAGLIKTGLEAEGFVVDCVHDGEVAQRRIEFYHNDYDAVLLDLMLPGRDGLEICRHVRAKNIAIPILMLTARDQNDDITSGLNVGADDYLVKPFSFAVLVARLRALLRRPKNALPSALTAGDLELDPVSRRVLRKKKPIRLTHKEFSLLEYFMRHPNQVLNREQILAKVWDFAFDSFSNVVDVHITNLRKKISDENGRLLETVFGVGYRLNA